MVITMLENVPIQSPQLPFDDPDRDVACKRALEPFFKELAASAERSGWSGDESAMALFSIAVAYMKDHEAKRRTNWSAQRALASLDRIVGHGD